MTKRKIRYVRQKSHKMNKSTKWVIGHQITPKETTGDYDLVIGETPAHVPGPPPHYHEKYSEAFIVIEGEMDFVIDGQPRTVVAGESVDLPPGTLHTFSNNSDSACKWVNIHSPKGFLEFFEQMGVSTEEDGAFEKSVDDKLIQKVIQQAPQFDMVITMGAPHPSE